MKAKGSLKGEGVGVQERAREAPVTLCPARLFINLQGSLTLLS